MPDLTYPHLPVNNRFPTDRVVYFSDAIFAIAITLLVLEIKLPSWEEVREHGIDGVLARRIPNFMGYLISFFVTALFWKAHLNSCKYIKKEVDGAFLWLNLWLLLFVVLMPFSTALYSNYPGSNQAFLFYCGNVAAIGILMSLFIRRIVRTEGLEQLMGRTVARWMVQRSLVVAGVFLLSGALVFVSVWVSRYTFLLIFVIHAWGDRRIKRSQRLASESAPPAEA
ncbi:MAG: TMEM175 family protein [Cyclobacteriaceae bacterium]|nr:TMEM175 family protein [Cyclobacteriaceae bacterium]